MAVQINTKDLPLEEFTVQTLSNIDELSNAVIGIKKFYYFQFKSAESAKNFGCLSGSIADKEAHHSFANVEMVTIEENNNIRIKPIGQKSDFVLSFVNIPKNYQFDIVHTSTNEKILAIYNNTLVIA